MRVDLLHQSLSPCHLRRFFARMHIEFGEDGGDVMIDRLGGEMEFRGDFAVGQALCYHGQNLHLARGQAEGFSRVGCAANCERPTVRNLYRTSSMASRAPNRSKMASAAVSPAASPSAKARACS